MYGIAGLVILGVTAAGVGQARTRRELREQGERHREQLENVRAMCVLDLDLFAEDVQRLTAGAGWSELSSPTCPLGRVKPPP